MRESKEEHMPDAKRKKTATRRVKTLSAKRIVSGHARNVRGGYIGDTEKSKSAAKKGAI
jgi:hypothetical protein